LPAGYDIVGRRFDSRGLPRGPEFLVNSQTAGRQDNPAIASDGAGNFVVVWSSDTQEIRGQRFDATAARLGAEFAVNATPSGPHRTPAVAASDSGFVVAWTRGPGYDVSARRFDPAGVPLGGDFQVNTYTTGGALTPSVAADAAGDFVVVWDGVYTFESHIRGQRFDAGGSAVGAEFIANSGTFDVDKPRVGRGPGGSFVVTWTSSPFGVNASDVLARRFDGAGVPVGPDFLVNAYTTARQRNADVAVDRDGDFVIVWESEGQDGSGFAVNGRRFAATGAAGPEFRVNTGTTADQNYPSLAADPAGNFVVTWHTSLGAGIAAQRYAGGLMPSALAVDDITAPAPNGVLEPGESVFVEPSWLNANFDAQTFTGTATFTGPGSPGLYTMFDAAADYGTVASGSTRSCLDTTNCYTARVELTTVRPAFHWDATLRETIAPAALGAAKNWPVHVGDSFSDVPRTNGFYRFVETLLHHGVTGGCTAAAYCPSSSTTREQMAVFVLVAKEGPGYVPPSCFVQPFADVAIGSPFCPWIAELARRGVVAGCGGNNYCPSSLVARDGMSVFVLRTLDAAINPPPCGATPMFTDVPPSSPFCRWVEELARRGVVGGCGGGAYCPGAAVTREQMAVFLSVTFGLTLYGP
jgi:hypothetical protein